MGRKPLEKERVDDPLIKNKWIQELAILYFQHGLKKFTMDEITSKLGISKATLYKYFASKDEILDEVVRYKIEQVEAFEKYMSDDQITFTELYFDVIKSVSIILAEISDQFLIDAKKKHPQLWKRLTDFQDRALLVAEKFYEKGIEAGVMHQNNPKLLALTDKMFIRSVSNPKFLEEYNFTKKEAFDAYFTMKSQGIFKN